VRPVDATAGYLAGAAGGLRLLLVCCSSGLTVALSYANRGLGLLEHVAFWGLVAASLAALARSLVTFAGSARGQGGRAPRISQENSLPRL